MIRLTKTIRYKILALNEGYIERTYCDSRNHSYEREYKISNGKLQVHETGRTSWADGQYDRKWIADDEETHRFLCTHLWKLNIGSLEYCRRLFT